MALTNAYVQVYGQLPGLFQQMSEGSAPSRFTTQHLKDWGYTSSNYRAVIPLLKALGFLSGDGTPTARYHEYRNTAQAKRVMGEAVREAYSDLFTIRSNPTSSDRALIEGKFKSTHNVSPNIAKLMASTFYALLGLADLSQEPPAESNKKIEDSVNEETPPPDQKSEQKADPTSKSQVRPNLHYNIQIHLPATKDVEVFNAIFKSLKEHLID